MLPTDLLDEQCVTSQSLSDNKAKKANHFDRHWNIDRDVTSQVVQTTFQHCDCLYKYQKNIKLTLTQVMLKNIRIY